MHDTRVRKAKTKKRICGNNPRIRESVTSRRLHSLSPALSAVTPTIQLRKPWLGLALQKTLDFNHKMRAEGEVTANAGPDANAARKHAGA